MGTAIGLTTDINVLTLPIQRMHLRRLGQSDSTVEKRIVGYISDKTPRVFRMQASLFDQSLGRLDRKSVV